MASLSSILGPPTPPPRIAYNPNRITPAQSVLIPISAHESFLCESTLNPLHAKKPRQRQASPPPAPVEQSKNGLASLPQKPQPQSQANERTNKRPNPPTSSNQPNKRAHTDVAVVADYYNARPNTSVDLREQSPIIGLKNFNNWIKSVFIAKFCKRPDGRRIKVLDLGCGKGGDLQKWQKAGTDEYIGVDLAAVSIDQAVSRWEGLRNRFTAGFFVLDAFNRPLTDVLHDVHTQRLFDVVSMQFCIHYAFENEAKARQMLENVTMFLTVGGLLVGTMPDSRNLLHRLSEIPEEAEELSFGNDVFKVKFDDRDMAPRYGHRYTFFLQDAVEEVPEYVVYWDEFLVLAAEYGLRLLYHSDFHTVFMDERETPEFSALLSRMKVMNEDGTTDLTGDQWEATNLYAGFVFTKD